MAICLYESRSGQVDIDWTKDHGGGAQIMGGLGSSSCVDWPIYLVEEQGEKSEKVRVGAMDLGAIYLSFGRIVVTTSVTRLVQASAACARVVIKNVDE